VTWSPEESAAFFRRHLWSVADLETVWALHEQGLTAAEIAEGLQDRHSADDVQHVIDDWQ